MSIAQIAKFKNEDSIPPGEYTLKEMLEYIFKDDTPDFRKSMYNLVINEWNQFGDTMERDLALNHLGRVIPRLVKRLNEEVEKYLNSVTSKD
jgi:hypothetical protein